MPEVALLGGSGFIGRALQPRLLAAGWNVAVLSRSTAPGVSEDGRTRYGRANVADPDSLGRELRGADAVVMMSTGGGDTWADFQRDFVDAARHVSTACGAAGVSRLVFLSSTAALYLGDRTTVGDEGGPDPHPEQRALYARAKIESERLLAAQTQVPVVILRPAVVVGRGGAVTHSGIGYWPNDICCLGWGPGENPLPFVLVEDVAAAIVGALSRPGIEGRAYNLAGDVRPSAQEFVHTLRQQARRQYEFRPQSFAKLQAIDWFKWGVKAAARKRENPTPSIRDLRSRAFLSVLDCSGAKRDLGWQPNADPAVFAREAIAPHITPIPPGDLRRA